MSKKTKLAAATGGLALALFAGSGIASADPILNTTCAYPQVIAALNAQAPDAAAQFTSNGLATGWLQSFLVAPPARRQQLYTQAQALPVFQENIGLINSVANTCNNF
jgi:hemophore-related protein